MEPQQKSKILAVFKRYTLGVLSTVALDNLPESALVGFGETEDLELVFGCFNSTRKYKNLQNNPSISFVVGGNDSKTIQYEGAAKEVFDQEREKYVSVHIKKKPSFEKYSKIPGNCYFKVLPKLIRYVDLDNNEEFEIKF